jgi:hypothetical protein
MQLSGADVITILIALAVAAAVTTTVWLTDRPTSDGRRRTWLIAAILVVVITAIGAVDVYTRSPREIALSTLLLGATLPVAGAVGMVRATHRLRPWIRWLLAFATAFLLLFGGLLAGASYISRMIGF